jgi:hypothetical protein
MGFAKKYQEKQNKQRGNNKNSDQNVNSRPLEYKKYRLPSSGYFGVVNSV